MPAPSNRCCAPPTWWPICARTKRRPKLPQNRSRPRPINRPALAADMLPAALTLPKCEKGIGAVITAPDSAHLIDGVKVQPYALWPDDRGYFLEVARTGQGLVAGFPQECSQISAALNHPG